MRRLSDIYCDGYLATPIIETCRKRGFFDLLEGTGFRLQEWLVREIKANAGYFAIALEVLEAIGWLEGSPKEGYRLTKRVKIDWFTGDLTSLYGAELQQLTAQDPQVTKWVDESQRILLKSNEAGDESSELALGAIVVPLAQLFTEWE
jgi:hypothetical protein